MPDARVIRILMSTLLRLFALGAFAAALPAVAQTKAEPPVPVRMVSPEYPRDLKREGVSGLVMVKCTVDEQGNVIATEIVKSSHEAFEKPAVDALKRWKFKPAKQDGAAIAMKVSIPIKFVQEG
jgi:periplasmic protein TonB